MIQIEILDHTVELPDRNCLLRSLQYVAGDSIAYGRFCWNDECGNCEVVVIGAETGERRTVRACQEIVYPGMRVVEISDEIILDLE